MKKFVLKVLILFFIVFAFQFCSEPLIPDQQNEDLVLKSAKVDKKSYIVVVNDSQLNTDLKTLKGYEKKQAMVKAFSAKVLKRAGITDGEVEYVYGNALQGFSVKIPPGQLKKMQNDPSVSFIEEDQLITLVKPAKKPGGKPGGGGGGGGTPSQTTPWGITRVNGGVSGATGTAWIIDTGVDFDHPDLNVDISRSANFTRAKSADDDNGHGSHVAGTIAALDNNIGVIGVAAGATVVPVKVLDRRGSGYNSWVIAGIDYVAANGTSGDVVNMSLGGGTSTALDDAVIAAAATGVKFALAAGNESDDANNHSPARINGPNIFTISAMDINNDWAYFSNFGNPPVDFCEPGVNIYSCFKGGGYTTMSGTSMAAPHAAGLLLLGAIKSDGTVNGDPDGNADPIGVH